MKLGIIDDETKPGSIEDTRDVNGGWPSTIDGDFPDGSSLVKNVQYGRPEV